MNGLQFLSGSNVLLSHIGRVGLYGDDFDDGPHGVQQQQRVATPKSRFREFTVKHQRQGFEDVLRCSV